MTDPTGLGVAELGAAFASGRLTAGAAAEAFLDRIDRLDGAIRSFVHVDRAGALAAAAASDARRKSGGSLGPLDGVPIGVKDNIDVAGMPCAGGIGAYRGRIPETDAFCVTRLRAAGAVILGKLNMHEGALGATTDNPFFGRCENPLRPGHTPGGSSGGSGAAVAAGFCPLTLGTDTMGSVRIPAAYCGVVGLKPTFGLISTCGVMPLSWRFDHVGPLARSVTDVGIALEALAGWDERCPESRAAPEGWMSTLNDRVDPEGVRVGYLQDLAAVDLSPGVAEAYHGALDRLRQLGARLVPVSLAGWDPGKARRGGLLLAEAEAAYFHAGRLAGEPDGFSPSFQAMLKVGAEAASARLIDAERRVAACAHLFEAAFVHQGLDALATPTAPQPAFPHDGPVPANQADFTAPANFTGRPALSLPLGTDPDGLPLGFQLIGRSWGESALLAIAVGLVPARDVGLFVED